MRVLKIAAVLAVLALCSPQKAGAFPQFILYQGRYLNAGVPSNGAVSMEFRITNGASPACGTAANGTTVLWTSAVQSVATSSGVFSYKLGYLADQATQDPVFMGINWATTNGSIDVCVAGTSLLPHEPIGSGVYALYASSAGAATDATKVAKAGDTMTGALAVSGPETATTDELLRLTKVSFGGTLFKQYYDPSTAYGLQLVGTEARVALVTDTGANPPRVGVGGVLLPRTNLDVNGNAQFGAAATKSTFTATGALNLASGAALTLAGPAGSVVSAASVTASGFFGSGAGLTGVVAAGAVAKTGDTMTGALAVSGPETATTDELLRLTKVSFGGTLFKQYYDPSTAYGLQLVGTEARVALVTDTGANPPRVGVGGVLLPRTNLDVNGNAQFGAAATKSTFTATGALNLASGAALTLADGDIRISTTSGSRGIIFQSGRTQSAAAGIVLYVATTMSCPSGFSQLMDIAAGVSGADAARICASDIYGQVFYIGSTQACPAGWTQSDINAAVFGTAAADACYR